MKRVRLLVTMAIVCVCCALIGGAAMVNAASPVDFGAQEQSVQSVGGSDNEWPHIWQRHPGTGRDDTEHSLGYESMDLASAQAGDIFVSETENAVFGTVEPGSRVWLRLYDAGGVEKAFNLIEADGQGGFMGYMFPNGVQGELDDPVDITAGDRVTVEFDGLSYEVMIPAMPVTVDIPTDRVYGTLVPYAEVSLYVKGQSASVAASFAGAFSYSFIPIMDLMPADDVRVRFPVGQLWVEKYAFAPGMLVHESANVVMGYVEPGTTVTGTLYAGDGSAKGVGVAQSLVTSGYYSLVFGDEVAIDIDAGDQVELVTSGVGSQVETTTVLPLSAEVGVANDTVSGTAPAGQMLRIIVRHQDNSGVRRYVRRVAANAQGQFSVSFAGVVDIGPEDDVEVTARSGTHATQITPQSRRVLIDQYYDTVEGVTTPTENVVVNLYGADGSLLETQTVRGNGETGEYVAGFDTDIVGGQSVEVSGATVSATVPVVAISVLVDIDNDLLNITGPPSSVLFGTHFTQGIVGSASLFVTTNASGVGQIVLEEYDLRDGDSGRLYYVNANGDVNLYRYIQPSLTAGFHLGRVMTWVDRTADVDMAVYGAGGNLKESISLGTNDGGWTEWWPESGFDVGDRLTVACCGGRQAELTMVDLSARPDTSANTISGHGPADVLLQSEVTVRKLTTGEELVYSKTTTSGIDGSYLADYGGQVDISNDDRVRVWWVNPDGDRIFADRYCTQLTVNQTSSAIFGQGLEYNASATITLTDAQGAQKASITVDTDRDGDLDWTILPAQIEFGDHLTLDDGYAQTLIPIDGIYLEIIPDEDRVLGNGLPDSSLLVYVEHPAGSELWLTTESHTSPSGAINLDLSGVVDILAGDEVELYQTLSSGHRVGVHQSALRLAIHDTSNQVLAWSRPGAIITLTLRSQAGAVKEMRVLETDPATGRTAWSERQFDTDIHPGDTLESQSGALFVTTHIRFIGARLDLAQNQVVGRVTPESYVEVIIYPRAGLELTLTGWSDENGHFALGPDNGYQLMAGDLVDVWYTDENGHWLGTQTNAVISYGLPLIQRGG